MVNYECFRCGYIASQKNNLRNHLNRKNICNPILDNVSIELIKNYYGFETKPQDTPKLHQTSTKIHQNDENNIHQNPPKSTKKLYM